MHIHIYLYIYVCIYIYIYIYVWGFSSKDSHRKKSSPASFKSWGRIFRAGCLYVDWCTIVLVCVYMCVYIYTHTWGLRVNTRLERRSPLPRFYQPCRETWLFHVFAKSYAKSGNVGLFGGNIGLFCGNTGLLSGNIELVCGNVGVFCENRNLPALSRDLTSPRVCEIIREERIKSLRAWFSRILPSFELRLPRDAPIPCVVMSRVKYEWFKSHTNDSCCIWMIMSHINESCPIWMSHVPYEWVMSHMNGSCPIWMGHVPYKWVMFHLNESCPTSCELRLPRDAPILQISWFEYINY